MEDLAQALTNSLSRDGRGGMTGPLRMNGQRLVGMAPGTEPTDAATVAQIVDGPPGPPGTSDNTYTPANGGLAAFKASDIGRRTASLVGIPGVADGRFNWTLGNYVGQADDVNIVASNSTPQSTGAWVRQRADGIVNQASASGAVQESLAATVSRAVLTPEQFGAVGYATRDAAAAGPFDSTSAIQAFYNAMSALGVAGSGNGRWYRCGNAEVQSNTDLRAISFFQKPGSVDASPFAITGKNNVTLTDCQVDGNRINQTSLATSGGDGQRSGFKIYGRCDNIRLIRPVAEYCATEGIHCWIGTTIPANGTDYLQRRVYIEEPRCNWNGRHGISTASQRGFRLVGGSARDNGKDVPGATGPYANGGYGRTANGQLGGPKYGRGLTAESFLPGEGYNGWEVDGFDGRGNIGGLLIYHRVWAGQTQACFDTMVRNCKFDDPFGGNGDGSGVIFAIDNGTGTAYTGSDAFSGLRLLNNTWGRNYVNVNSATDVVVEAGSAIITTGNYSVIFTNCANVFKCDLPSNKPVLGRPSPISNVSITTTSGWTIGANPVLSVPSDRAGGRLTYRFAFNVTPTGAGQALFRLAFTPGFVLTPARPNAQNTVTGLIVDATAFPGSNGANEIDVYVMANGANLSVVALDFEAERLP